MTPREVQIGDYTYCVVGGQIYRQIVAQPGQWVTGVDGWVWGPIAIHNADEANAAAMLFNDRDRLEPTGAWAADTPMPFGPSRGVLLGNLDHAQLLAAKQYFERMTRACRQVLTDRALQTQDSELAFPEALRDD
jgi:hypothetical protein